MLSLEIYRKHSHFLAIVAISLGGQFAEPGVNSVKTLELLEVINS